VPHEVYRFKFHNGEEYNKELTALIMKYKTLTENMGITTDGLVLQVNDRHLAENEHTATAADGDNLAVKAVAWEASVFSSKVTNIVIQPSANQYCCKAIVEPVYTESDKKLSVVNLYNPDTMIRNNVNIGSVIEFKYENETTISFLRNLSG
jgi:NAD-dependent DNA ligase